MNPMKFVPTTLLLLSLIACGANDTTPKNQNQPVADSEEVATDTGTDTDD